MGGSTVERSAETRALLALDREVEAPGRARDAFDRLDHGLDYQGEYAVKLLLSELVSNSVKYGGDGPVEVQIEVARDCVHVEVVDCGPGFRPARRNGGLEDVGGWGLVLVRQLASRWGYSARHCRVWFEIDR